jgi:hypothetical protein
MNLTPIRVIGDEDKPFKIFRPDSQTGTLGETMPVPAAIRVSKYILGLVALIDLAVAAVLTLMRSGFADRQLVSLIVTACLLINALWAFATAVGLARLRRWSRISILIRAGIYLPCGILGSIAEIVARLLPDRYPIAIDSPAAAAVLVGLALLFPAVAILGLAWLIYFTRRTTRALFRNPAA